MHSNKIDYNLAIEKLRREFGYNKRMMAELIGISQIQYNYLIKNKMITNEMLKSIIYDFMNNVEYDFKMPRLKDIFTDVNMKNKLENKDSFIHLFNIKNLEEKMNSHYQRVFNDYDLALNMFYDNLLFLMNKLKISCNKLCMMTSLKNDDATKILNTRCPLQIQVYMLLSNVFMYDGNEDVIDILFNKRLLEDDICKFRIHESKKINNNIVSSINNYFNSSFEDEPKVTINHSKTEVLDEGINEDEYLNYLYQIPIPDEENNSQLYQFLNKLSFIDKVYLYTHYDEIFNELKLIINT